MTMTEHAAPPAQDTQQAENIEAGEELLKLAQSIARRPRQTAMARIAYSNLEILIANWVEEQRHADDDDPTAASPADADPDGRAAHAAGRGASSKREEVGA